MFLFSDGLSVIVRGLSLISNKNFLFQHDLTPCIYALHKIKIALKFVLHKSKVAANLSNRVKFMSYMYQVA